MLLSVTARRPLVVSRFWVRLSHELAKPTQEAAQKIHRARVNTLLFGADRLLLTPRADTLEAYLMTKISDDTFYNTYRATAFMRLIRFCLERQLFDVALALHNRMLKEGFVAVRALSLHMIALDIVCRATNLKAIAPPLKVLFEKKAYSVSAFTDLVHYLTDDKRAPGTLVDDLAHAFVSIRQIRLSEYPDLVGLLARVNMRAHRLDAAQKWIQAFEDACGAQGIQPDVGPYSEIISTLHDINPKNTDAIQDVLVHMKSAGVAPDTNVFNALMRVNLVQQRYQEAFALYHVLMEKRSDDLMPNDVTYKMLFRATNVFNHPRLARRHRRPENLVLPRRLFREMIVCHLDQTKDSPSGRSTVISVSAFHLALRTFMAHEDYAAVYIAIRAMFAFDFEPNLQTYLIIVVNLLHRMKHEANLPCPEGSFRLVDFITHLRPDEDPDLRTLLDRIRHHRITFGRTPSSMVNTETISHLLRLGKTPRITSNGLPDTSILSGFPSQRQRDVLIPTVAMLTDASDAATSQRTFFSPVPLARIVHKALLGELFRKAVHRGTDWDWKGAVGPIIEETEREMIPDGVVQRIEALEKRDRGERGEAQGTLPFAAARMRRRRRSARGGREIAFDFES